MAYRPARWLLTLLDLAFWAVALVLVAVGLYFTDWLSLRLYAAFVIALGCLAALYLAGFFFRFVSYALTRGMLTVFWLFLRPLRWFTRTLGRHQGRRSRPTGGARGDPRTGNKSASTRRGKTARPWWVPGG